MSQVEPRRSGRKRMAPKYAEHSDDEPDLSDEEEQAAPRKPKRTKKPKAEAAAAAPKRRPKKQPAAAEADDAPEALPPAAVEPPAVNGEVRQLPFRNRASKDGIARIERARTQRLFLIERKPVENLTAQFIILGSTGNVYTVTIKNIPKCNCPDMRRRKESHCKHVLFVLLKVLRVPYDSYLVYQQALLDSELTQIFANSAPDPTAVASEQLQKQYGLATGKIVEPVQVKDADEGNVSKYGVERKPLEGDCPICYEELEEGAEEIVWCKRMCGNNVHKQCIDQWNSSPVGGNTCVYCRAEWGDVGAKAAGPAAPVKKVKGYVNLL